MRLARYVWPWLLGSALASATLPANAAAPARSYIIAAGQLGHALDALAAQSDIDIVYAPDLVAGKLSPALNGRYAPEDALRHLLVGSGLTWKAVGTATYVLQYAASPHRVAVPAKVEVARDEPRTFDPVTVSGSLIASAQIQTATPTYSMSAETIAARGFNSVGEALQNIVLASGGVQGPQTAGSFTQGAQAVSLNGFGPGFTSILIDGKPIAAFGRLYDGTSNFTSVANLPLSMVERIDVMPGGASSIYGSQAVAGVINLITRQHIDGFDVSVRAGRYGGGGGGSQRLSLGYGHDAGPFSVTALLEFDHAEPIWGYQRHLTASTAAGGSQSLLPQAAILDYGSADTYIGGPAQSLHSPPAGCAPGLFGGNNVLASVHNLPGTYCATSRGPGYVTFSNREQSADGMLKLKYDISPSVQLYGDLLLDWQAQRWYTGLDAWYPDDFTDQGIEDAATGNLLYLERTFAPEEMPGGVAGQMTRQRDLLYQGDIGAHGKLGGSDWDWDVYFLRSADRTNVTERLINAPRADAFFSNLLGPSTVDDFLGLQTFQLNEAAFFAPLQPSQYASFTDGVDEYSKTWINNTRATVSNTSLFHLPGGDASIAVLAEGGSEAWYAPLAPAFADGDVFEHATAGGGGRRSHQAAAFEINLPWLRQLTVDLSGRYDYYSAAEAASNSRFTYKLGLEYRPFDSLLLRGNYTTAFKAPDLSALYLAPSSYYVPVTDYYRCVRAGASNCSRYTDEVLGVSLANRQLQPTTAQSWDLGAVWSPWPRLSASLDYLHTAVKDEVIAQDIDVLLHEDAQCLLGQLDNASALCQAITNPDTGQVQRSSPILNANLRSNLAAQVVGPITGITTYYANLANEVVDSLVASTRYQGLLHAWGRLELQLAYSDILRHRYQLAPGQMPIDTFANPRYNDGYKSSVTGSLGWTSPNGRWQSTLYGRRFGALPNARAEANGYGTPGAGRLHPWITFNGSLSYAPSRTWSLSMMLNNIADKMPPRDASDHVYPYFDVENYNIYGREVMLQARYSFGAATP